MTTRQHRRLELAESVCRLAMRHHSCGLVENEGFCPDIVTGLYVMQREAERLGGLKPDSLPWLGRHAEELQAAVFSWMESVGIDPASHEKSATQRCAMEMAREALGPEYEAEVEQLPAARRKWVERTAEDRASAIAQEYCAGRMRGFEELRIAIAAEILEAEHVARDPFVEFARSLFDLTRTHDLGDGQQKLTEACAGMLSLAWRWMGLEPKDDTNGPARGPDGTQGA